MRKHPFLGVLALAMLLAVAGLTTLNAGQMRTGTGPDGECCVLVDGVCVPCDDIAGTANTATAKPSLARLANSTSSSMSGCDGPCTPMTPEQCAAVGCDPAQCASGTSGKSGALIGAKTQIASACGSGPCVPSQGCGSAGGCGAGASMTVIGVRDATTGQVTYYAMPLSTARALLARSAAPRTSVATATDGDI